ncbi:MAG: hypothetical protein L3K17_00315 [Thermoplasmata archaeon]|nr:hypothetical protein [Thermoplasmata archaeon]
MPQESVGTAPQAGGPAPIPAPSGSILSRIYADFKGLILRMFPAETDEPRTRTGFASDSRRDPIYLLVALAIAVGFAVLWLWIVRVQPIPPGGDPSTWIITSYPFVGLPTTSGVQPLAYPPLAFPFVGLSVLIGNGPLLGGRIFMASSIVALGYASYLLNRSLLERPGLALLAQGLLLGEPDFQQLYYFGGYPNIFALIFLVLAVAYLVRYLRSRQPSHLFLFWVATAACLLSHSLTGVILVGILALLALGLLLVRRLPRTILWSRAGLAGVGVFVVGVGGYYLATYFANIAHASYFDSTASATKTQLLPTVLRPFYLTSPWQWITHSPQFLTPHQALAIIALGTAVCIGAVLLLRWRRPAWLTTPWLTLVAWFLAIFAGSLAAYAFSIPIDYRRFPYFLYTPVILAALFPFDWALSEWLSRDWSAYLMARAARRHRAPPPVRPRWRSRVDPTLTAGAVAGLVVVAILSTSPSGVSYETYYTQYAHNDAFLSAVNAIAASGVVGNLVATTPFVAHWPSTITATRTTYVPALANGNGYVSSHVQDGEATSISLTGRYTVTNALVGATVPGVAAGDFNSTPIIGAFAGNIYQPLFQMPAASIVVNLSDGSEFLVAPATSAAPPITQIDGGYGYEFSFPEPGCLVVENVTVPAASDLVQISLSARANGSSVLVTSLQARFSTVNLVPGNVTLGSSPGSFAWASATRNGNFTTTGTVAPAVALGRLVAYNSTPGATTAVLLRLNSTQPNGSGALAMSVNLAIPAAYNLISSIGPWLDTSQIWTGWDIRFILSYSQVAALHVTTNYIQSEYDGAVLSTSGPWTVYVLPASFGGG